MQRLLLAALVAAAAAAAPRRVAVTGAGGQTGQLAFRRMLARRDEFDPIGIVRNAARRDELVEKGVPSENVRVADVTDANAILEALEGCEALLIGSSAKVATLEFDTGVIDPATGRPKLGFPKGQPYDVDWLGQRNQIDAAKTCGCNHVVICSSMGGTDENHMLNGLGRDENDPATKGNILQWKRKAKEQGWVTSSLIHDEIVVQHSNRFLDPNEELQSLCHNSKLGFRAFEDARGWPPGSLRVDVQRL